MPSLALLTDLSALNFLDFARALHTPHIEHDTMELSLGVINLDEVVEMVREQTGDDQPVHAYHGSNELAVFLARLSGSKVFCRAEPYRYNGSDIVLIFLVPGVAQPTSLAYLEAYENSTLSVLIVQRSWGEPFPQSAQKPKRSVQKDFMGPVRELVIRKHQH